MCWTRSGGAAQVLKAGADILRERMRAARSPLVQALVLAEADLECCVSARARAMIPRAGGKVGNRCWRGSTVETMLSGVVGLSQEQVRAQTSEDLCTEC